MRAIPTGNQTFLQKEKASQQRVAEMARENEMSPAEFRKACLGMIMQGEASPAHLVKQGLAQRLNVVFDIDHTLIHSVNEAFISRFPENA